MSTTDPRKLMAASYSRLATVLKVSAANHRRAARRLKAFPEQVASLTLRAQVADDLAAEFRHEARTLRAEYCWLEECACLVFDVDER